ncbi:MAG: hypothetical protein NTV62_01670 [Candidatus Gribaldobacteria bacterium]|nr:hypothetical protein [Candidatus Gribaldobacteria bacterium]
MFFENIRLAQKFKIPKWGTWYIKISPTTTQNGRLCNAKKADDEELTYISLFEFVRLWVDQK